MSPVYVDPLVDCLQTPRWRHRQSSHLVADTLTELHTFAERIGLKRSWFQDKSLPHYDLSPGMRRTAIAHGVISLCRGKSVLKWREIRRAPKPSDEMLGEGRKGES